MSNALANDREECRHDLVVEMLRIARHDFKTPLTSLRMLAQMFQLSLEKGTLSANPERTARNCQLMVDQVDKLVALADILSDVALIESGHFNLNKIRCDLRPIIEDSLGPENGVEIRLPAEVVEGAWDVARLGQSLKYLISCFAPKQVKIKKEDGVARIVFSPVPEVSDFYKPSAKLHISRYVIEAHGGKIEESGEITLPVSK
ncbi:MAG: histidine kinase dimerization/phospho-acceptor domain-containing protein [Bdellovibrionota bacterium]